VAERLNLKILPCITTDWHIDDLVYSTLEEKLYFLCSNTNYVTDVTPADNLSYYDLYQIQQQVKVVKVFTSFKNDLENLEPVWSQYDQLQWKRNICYGLWIYDEIINFDSIVVEPPGNANLGDVIFTPSRSGSHVLKGVTRIDTYFHHDNDLLTNQNWQTVIHANQIYTVMRRDFLGQVLSHHMTNLIGFRMRTLDFNLEENQKIISNIQPGPMTADTLEETLNFLISFVDYLLFIKLFVNQNIKFTCYEDLHPHYHKIPHKKNPYQARDYVTNIEEIEPVIKKKYNPIYQHALGQIGRVVGLAIL
jgi:hypothetical protein